jgi:putative hydrolase of the HAD superfamily
MNALVLDVGGVLCADAVAPKVGELAARHGLSEPDLLDQARRLRSYVDTGALSENEFWARLLRERGLEPTMSDLSVEAFAAPMPGARGMIDFARDRGFRLAVLTNDSVELFAARQRALGACNDFAAIVVSAAIGITKPDPRIYRSVLSALAVQPGECLFVDDRADNVEAARNLGMQGVVFESHTQVMSILARDVGSVGR